MSDDEIRAAVLSHLRRSSPSSTRAVRAAVKARAGSVDEALRALLSKNRVVATPEGWYRLYADGTRYGHETCRVRPGGLQVSYWKAVDAVAASLFEAQAPGHDAASAAAINSTLRREAAEILRPALSNRQRARLAARTRT